MFDETDRGEIKYLNRYKQLISYAGLERRRKITPTDIDGLIDYNGQAFIYLEAKLEGKLIEVGQRRALENMVVSHTMAGHFGCAILFNHNCEPDRIIDAKGCRVNMIFFANKWTKPKTEVTVLQCIENIEKYCENNGYEI